MLASPVRTSLIVSAIALAAFGAVAAAVVYVPGVNTLDESIAQRLNQEAKASPPSVQFQLGVTYLGTSPFLIGLSLGVVVVLLLRRQWQIASGWVIIQLVVIVLIEKTKIAFGRPRPIFNGEFAREDSYSFPSGHALGSMVVFGTLVYLFTLSVTDRRQRRAAMVLATVVIALIGFSRVYLGVHFLSDIIGGYLLGAAWLAFSIALIEDIRRHYSNPRTSAGQ